MPSPSCQRILIRSPRVPRNTYRSPACGSRRRLAGPAAPSRSCRGACPSRPSPATPARPTEPGSSPFQDREHPRQRRGVDPGIDDDPASVRDDDLHARSGAPLSGRVSGMIIAGTNPGAKSSRQPLARKTAATSTADWAKSRTDAPSPIPAADRSSSPRRSAASRPPSSAGDGPFPPPQAAGPDYRAYDYPYPQSSAQNLNPARRPSPEDYASTTSRTPARHQPRSSPCRPAPASPFNGINPSNFSTPAFGDVDGDGDHDMVLGTHGGTVLYYKNTGTGVGAGLRPAGRRPEPASTDRTGRYDAGARRRRRRRRSRPRGRRERRHGQLFREHRNGHGAGLRRADREREPVQRHRCRQREQPDAGRHRQGRRPRPRGRRRQRHVHGGEEQHVPRDGQCHSARTKRRWRRATATR